MKKVVIIGSGAQGSTIAKRIQEDQCVSEIICADHDLVAAKSLEESLPKAKGIQVDARDINSIIAIAKDADLIVNGLTTDFNFIVMEAALAVGSDYQDMAGPWTQGSDYIEGYKNALFNWGKKFAEKGRTALIGTGSAPGLANVIARASVDKLDDVKTIDIHVYDAIVSNKYILFWWSPEIALGDMVMETYSYVNGKHVVAPPFSNPVMMKFKGIEKNICMYDHAHDEPVSMGLNADRYLKGVKNVFFKYGGPSVDKARELYRMGLLSHKPVDVKGVKVAPFDVVIATAPPAPKYPHEIAEILKEGMASQEGAFLVRVSGTLEGKPVTMDSYVNSPGLPEAFEKSGLTHETYCTGQCAAVFTNLIVNEKIDIKGAVSPEALDAEARRYFFKKLAEVGVTVDPIELS
jgi:saccharopine dehydrogenase (NAD+, L-lysine forming)